MWRPEVKGIQAASSLKLNLIIGCSLLYTILSPAVIALSTSSHSVAAHLFDRLTIVQNNNRAKAIFH